MYIYHMKNELKIEQQAIALGNDSRTNFLILIETINDVPINTYIVRLHDFQFYNEKMLFYVINKN